MKECICGEHFEGSEDYCPDCSEEITCNDCGEPFHIYDFEDIDDEFNEMNPRCPACQEESRIASETCEYCDRPAQHETSDGYFCDGHYEDYIEHYPYN